MTDEGHAKVATLMSHHSELAIFRRFSKLNFQNLLYLQAELTHLEANLKKLVDRDVQNPNRQQYSRDWWFLAQNDDEHDDREQWDKFLQIRDKLKEYNEHLAQAVFLDSLKAPNKYDHAFIARWFTHEKTGNYPLLGIDWQIWSKDSTDLITIHRRAPYSPFSRHLAKTIIPYLHSRIFWRWKKHADPESGTGLCHYEDRKVERVVDILVTVLASLIPIASILILYFVANTLDRLAITVAFTGIFAFSLTVTTRARRVEVFAATSAFAAVLVVFVTGSNAPTPGPPA
ncbi:hypothetical protein V8E51_001853 [Hyaloscypha variabilis]